MGARKRRPRVRRPPRPLIVGVPCRESVTVYLNFSSGVEGVEVHPVRVSHGVSRRGPRDRPDVGSTGVDSGRTTAWGTRQEERRW